MIRSTIFLHAIILSFCGMLALPSVTLASLQERSLSEIILPSAALPGHIPYCDEITLAAEMHGIDPALLAALVKVESNFNPRAVGGGAVGLTQMNRRTASKMGVRNVFDPLDNLKGGARYLASCLKMFNGNEDMALLAYNQGPGAAMALKRRAKTKGFHFANKVKRIRDGYAQTSTKKRIMASRSTEK